MSPKKDLDEHELLQMEEELAPVLQSVLVSTPSQRETEVLIHSLTPMLAEHTQRDKVWNPHAWGKPPSLWRQMKTQAKLYGWVFWSVSVAAFMLMTWAVQEEVANYAAGDVFPLFIFVPLVLFASLLYGYRTWDRGMRMVESVTVFPPALTVLSRFLVVLGFDIALTLACSGYLLVAADPQEMTFNPFLIILYALAPLAFFFGAIAYTMLYKGIKVGWTLGVTLWMLGLVTPVAKVLFTPLAMSGMLGLGIYLSVIAYRKGAGASHAVWHQ